MVINHSVCTSTGEISHAQVAMLL